MAEQTANVIRCNAAAATGADHVDALSNAIMSGGLYWMLMNSSPGKLLLSCIATGAELVLHGTSTQIQVGYAPAGGITSWDTTPSAAVFTGMRNITGNASAFLSVTRSLDVAEYADSLLFAIGSSVAGWRYAALAGRAMKPMDESDIARAIGVDALFVGEPTRATANPGWLAGSTTATTGSCVLAGTSFSPVIPLGALVVDPGASAIADRYVARIGDNERLPPYFMHLTAAAGISQIVGCTKYIRQWRAKVSHGTRLFSQTAASDQAWFGHQANATQSNQFVLWNKNETLIP